MKTRERTYRWEINKPPSSENVAAFLRQLAIYQLPENRSVMAISIVPSEARNSFSVILDLSSREGAVIDT